MREPTPLTIASILKRFPWMEMYLPELKEHPKKERELLQWLNKDLERFGYTCFTVAIGNTLWTARNCMGVRLFDLFQRLDNSQELMGCTFISNSGNNIAVLEPRILKPKPNFFFRQVGFVFVRQAVGEWMAGPLGAYRAEERLLLEVRRV